MGCCDSNEPEENQPNVRTCTDVLWLLLYIMFWCLMVSSQNFLYFVSNLVFLLRC